MSTQLKWLVGLCLASLALATPRMFGEQTQSVQTYLSGWKAIPNAAVGKPPGLLKTGWTFQTLGDSFNEEGLWQLVRYGAVYAGSPVVLSLLFWIGFFLVLCFRCCCCGLCKPKRQPARTLQYFGTMWFFFWAGMMVVGCLVCWSSYPEVKTATQDSYDTVANAVDAINDRLVEVDTKLSNAQQTAINALNNIPARFAAIAGILDPLAKIGADLLKFLDYFVEVGNTLADTLTKSNEVADYLSNVEGGEDLKAKSVDPAVVQDLQTELGKINDEMTALSNTFNDINATVSDVVVKVREELDSGLVTIKSAINDAVSEVQIYITDGRQEVTKFRVDIIKDKDSHIEYVDYATLGAQLFPILFFLIVIPGLLGAVIFLFKKEGKGPALAMKMTGCCSATLFMIIAIVMTLTTTLTFVFDYACDEFVTVVNGLDEPIQLVDQLAISDPKGLLLCPEGGSFTDYVEITINFNASQMVKDAFKLFTEQFEKADVNQQSTDAKSNLDQFNNVTTFDADISEGVNFQDIRDALTAGKANLEFFRPNTTNYNQADAKVTELQTLNSDSSVNIDNIESYTPPAGANQAQSETLKTEIIDLKALVVAQIDKIINVTHQIEDNISFLGMFGTQVKNTTTSVKDNLGQVDSGTAGIQTDIVDAENELLIVAKTIETVSDIPCGLIGVLVTGFYNGFCVDIIAGFGNGAIGYFLVWLSLAMCMWTAMFLWKYYTLPQDQFDIHPDKGDMHVISTAQEGWSQPSQV